MNILPNAYSIININFKIYYQTLLIILNNQIVFKDNI